MKRERVIRIGYLVAALAIWASVAFWLASRNVAHVPYSDVMRMVAEGKVRSVTVTESTIEGVFKESQSGKTHFVSDRVDPVAAEVFEKAGVEVSGGTDSNWLTIMLSWAIPTLLLFGLWLFIFRGIAEQQGMGGLVSIGKSKAKVYLERATGVTFDDVAGADEAKAELQEIVSFLKDKERCGRLGAHIPKGILLVGPPRTGKTLLARAVAGEAGVPFFSISGSEFVELFVGVAPRGCAISFSRLVRPRHASYSSTNLTHLGALEAKSVDLAETMKRSRPSTSFCPSSTASTRAWASCCWPQPIAPRSLTLHCFVQDASTGRSW